MSRRAIVHTVAEKPDDDGRQRCVLCGKVLAGQPEEGVERMIVLGPQDRPGGGLTFWPGGHVTELGGDFIAGADSGSPVPHVPCVELKPA